MKKRTNWLALVIGLSLIAFFLFGIMRTGTALAASSAKTFSISSNSDFTKKVSINNLVAKVGDVISIYFYATNGGFTQCPEVLQAIPLTVTLTDPNNHSTVYNIIIPKGPSNTYGVLPNISCTLSGKWMVKVEGNPGKDNVSVTNTFTVVGNQASLNVIPAEATISLGSTQNFEALFTNSQGTSSGVTQVTWSSSNTSVATISSTGLATSTGLGTCVITAVYTINNVTYTDTSQLTIVPPTLIINPESATIPLGSTQQYQTTLEDSDGNPTDVTESVTWSSSSSGVATIESSGLATSKGVGISTITATYQISGVSISTKAMLMVVNLSITPVNKITSLGSTQQYQAKFTDSTGNVTDVTPLINQWSSISLGLVLAKISPSGLATANGLGVSLIQATYIINDVRITASTSLTIIKPTLNITPTTTTILLGSKQQYLATLTDFDGHPTDVTQSVTWSSDKTSVATIDTTGLATGSGVGTCAITGTNIINGVNITATTPLTVVNFSITPTTTTISLGSTQQYQAEFTDSTRKVTDVTRSQSVTWTSGSTGVATINPTGLATAYGSGNCIISATYMVDGVSITATASLIIVKPILSITPATTTISLGSKQQYQAILTDYAGHTTDVTQFVTWSSDKTSVVTIDNSGLATSFGGGTCTITETYIINGVSITATATLEIVNLSMVEALIVTPVPMTDAIFVGYTQQFSAQLKYSDRSTTSDVTNLVTWASGVGPVATIGNTGLVTGTSAGTSIISATLNLNNNPLIGSYLLTVLPLNGGIIREWELLP